MMWYPALNGQDREAKTRYAYAMKMGAPLGTVTFATFAGRAIRDAPYDLSAGPYPLVILSPGFSIGSSTYAWLAEHLASYGFVVIASEYQEQLDAELNGLWQATITRPQDILTVLAYVDKQVGSGHTLQELILFRSRLGQELRSRPNQPLHDRVLAGYAQGRPGRAGGALA